MSPETEALARRAVACPAWRWMTGARCLTGERVTIAGANGYVSHYTDGECLFGYDSGYEWGERIPDLTDPATLGCLLALVREAWGDPAIHCAPALYPYDYAPPEYAGLIHHWHCYAGRRYNIHTDAKPCSVVGPSEAAALVAALEAAPVRR